MAAENNSTGTFEATIQCPDGEKTFHANRVRMHDIITRGGARYLVIKGFEDTVNRDTGSKQINTIQFYLEKSPARGPTTLHPPLVLPEVRANSASYYILTDSPDDADDNVDAAWELPGQEGGEINYSIVQNGESAIGTFDFNAGTPGNHTFKIKGSFTIHHLEAEVYSSS